MERRSFLKALIAGGSTLAAGVVGVPALLAALSPVFRRRRDQAWSPVGPLDTFAPGSVTRAATPLPQDDLGFWPSARGVYVWRPSADEVVVFSRTCTDLGCPVIWDAGSEWFFCPCHGGIFSKDGERQAGPPKRGLYRFATRVRDGVVEIDLASVPPMS